MSTFDIPTVREDICRRSKVIKLPITGRERRAREVMCGLEITECGLTLEGFIFVCVVTTSQLY
jgi:hypothetical protein